MFAGFGLINNVIIDQHFRQRDRLTARHIAYTGPVDAFFDGVMVMDPDAALRENRLALLGQLHELFGGIADLSRLPG